MANPEGAFVLVRNVTDASTEAAMVHIVRGGADGGTLGPRETTVWECDDEALPLKLRTNDGTVLYDAPLACGDAVYVRGRAAASGLLQ